MAVQKMKWQNLMSNNTLLYPSAQSKKYFLDNLVNDIQAVDTAFASLFGSYTGSIYDLFVAMRLLTNDYSNNNPWYDMNIWTSSFKSKDKRVMFFIQNKLAEYVGFYKKVLTDAGVSRALMYTKTYQNAGNTSSNTSNTISESSSNTKNTTTNSQKANTKGGSSTRNNSSNVNEDGRKITSETPQNSMLWDSTTSSVTNAKFDQAIADYASRLEKNKVGREGQEAETISTNETDNTTENGTEGVMGTSTGSTTDSGSGSSTTANSGNSTTNVTGVTWEEARKNLSLMFFNELKDYIMRIPEMIYSYYSIDTMPFTDLTIEYFGYLHSLFESVE